MLIHNNSDFIDNIISASEKRTPFARKYTKKGLLEMLDALPLAVAVIDRNSVLEFANEAVYKFVKKKRAEVIGHVTGDAFGCIHHHDDTQKRDGFGKECLNCKLKHLILDTIGNKKIHHMVELIMFFKKHGKRDIRISTIPILLNHDEATLLAIEDITTIKKYNESIIEKEKLSVVFQTAGGICHEINQPLTVILGYSELLLSNITKDNPNFSALKELNKHIIRLGEITRKLMQLKGYRTKKYLSTEIIDIDASSGDYIFPAN